MSRQVFTADDIRRLARERAETLVLGQDDIVTHEARDVAFDLGVNLIRETGSISTTGKDASLPSLPSLKVVHVGDVEMDRFLEGQSSPGANVRLKDVVVTQDHSPMGAGYMSLDKGEMEWTLNYDEIDVVLEGELVITRGSEQVRGGVGDVIFIPKGSGITFGTPSRARFVYVVFPVNWNEK